MKLIPALSRAVFAHRLVTLVVFGLATLALTYFAARTHIDSSFTKQLPREHPFIQTALKHREQVGGANRVLIALFPRQGDMFTAEFFDTLRKATDEVFFLPGVDRSQVHSLFTPSTRYLEVVQEGFAGGPVVPQDFTPTPEGFQVVRENLIKSGKVGQIVASDFSGALISAQILDVDPSTGRPIDPSDVAKELETRIRGAFENDRVEVAIIGFAKMIGDVKKGAAEVVSFFGVTLLITLGLIWSYAGTWKLTWPLLLCSVVSVFWQMGLLTACGFGLDPFSLLVPFLIFAMAVSHGVQMIRAFRSEVFAGADAPTAAVAAFQQLLVPGGVALLSDTVGFLTILVIKIEAIQEMAIAASLGVAAIIFTNLILLPVILSYQTLGADYREQIRSRREKTDRFWRWFAGIMRPKPSILIILSSILLGVLSWQVSQRIRIGDALAGVPELRQESRYNVDTHAITHAFKIGVDIFTVVAETAPNGCVDPSVLRSLDALEGRLRELPGVQSVISVASVAKTVNSSWNEGSLRWRLIPTHPQALAQAVAPIETSTGLLNADGSVLPVVVYLKDHRAETLREVTSCVENFAKGLPTDAPLRLHLAAGNAGYMAATNQVVEAAQTPILLWVFGVVTVLCWITFRSWKATTCIMLPLVLVSWLAYAVMVVADIGLKTTTLPVVALGVGIGVDYGIYLFARLEEALERGDYLEDAMYSALTQAGSSIVFTGLALALGVGTWFFSDLKFQADMGLLLTFLFLVNMIAAVVLLPALARWFYRHHAEGDKGG